MIRIIIILVGFAATGAFTYLLIKAHIYLMFKWKRLVEEYEASEESIFSDEANLREFLWLAGFTIPVTIIDLLGGCIIYYIIKGLIT